MGGKIRGGRKIIGGGQGAGRADTDATGTGPAAGSYLTLRKTRPHGRLNFSVQQGQNLKQPTPAKGQGFVGVNLWPGGALQAFNKLVARAL